MAKRLYMTTADYLVIAISPALIMALVGSLVYFLIEVLYVGRIRSSARLRIWAVRFRGGADRADLD